jgi:hypothetical protein
MRWQFTLPVGDVDEATRDGLSVKQTALKCHYNEMHDPMNRAKRRTPVDAVFVPSLVQG